MIVAACDTGDSGDAVPPDSTAVATDSVRMPEATCNEHIFTGNGIGLLRIGLPVDSVSRVCNVTRDTVVRGVEGMMSRVLSVAIGSDTVLAEIHQDSVWRILVRSQGLYTTDSLSVGSSIGMLTALPELNPMVGEGYLYVATPAHCGMSFRLSEPPSSLPSGEWTNADLRALSPIVHVTRILLFGCPRFP